jgi:hypothetical protein
LGLGNSGREEDVGKVIREGLWRKYYVLMQEMEK